MTAASDQKSNPFVERRLIVVEGRTDQRLLAEYIDMLGLDGFQVHEVGGKSTWAGKIKAIALDDSFVANVKRLGVVRDADSDGRAALQSCMAAVGNAGFSAPTGVDTLGVENDRGVRVAVHIVPGPDATGAVEELVLPSLVSERLDCVESYLVCLAAKNLPTSGDAKSKVRIYLSGLPEKTYDLQTAFIRGYVDFQSPEFDGVKQFVLALASDDETPDVGTDVGSG